MSMIRDFVNTNGSVTHKIQLMEKLLRVCQSGELTSEIAEERTWQKTHQRLVSSLEQEFPLYRDITTPFIVALQQVRCGIRLIAGCVKEAYNAQQLTDRKTEGDQSDVISSLKLAQKILLVERLVLGCGGQVKENRTDQTSRS
ncbi:uncharacterized protein LOC133180623 [Saccostrea echinata]|uniref:uncharacterized protein LOC133180623 n=1 Tax=Saccostrea echinata TaxID=191078 RepID=UPI002A81AA2D|nr:uncharacterized protein LOC133180623 [Saccostrea echinata]